MAFLRNGHKTPIIQHHCQHASVVVSVSSVHKRQFLPSHLRIAAPRTVITPGCSCSRTVPGISIRAPCAALGDHLGTGESNAIPKRFHTIITLPNVQKRRRRRSFMTRVGNIQASSYFPCSQRSKDPEIQSKDHIYNMFPFVSESSSLPAGSQALKVSSVNCR